MVIPHVGHVLEAKLLNMKYLYKLKIYNSPYSHFWQTESHYILYWNRNHTFANAFWEFNMETFSCHVFWSLTLQITTKDRVPYGKNLNMTCVLLRTDIIHLYNSRILDSVSSFQLLFWNYGKYYPNKLRQSP